MADTSTTNRTLNLVYEYADDDTRTIKIPNAGNNFGDTATLKTKATALGQITLSDRSKGNVSTGAYVSVVSGSVVNQTITDLDLEN